MAILYWISQLVRSVMACLFLKVTTIAQHVPVHGIPPEMTGFGASILEGVRTFNFVYTVYVAGDPRRGPFGAIGPLAIKFIAMASLTSRLEHKMKPNALRAYLAEFISTFLFIFAAVGSDRSGSDSECICIVDTGLCSG
ncbi:putative aquaporin TIP5-1 [Camellia lanceoleosa]|uniref:Aquaporin TIP5-1 n=1 Tax=Camellia lanceoleosa TaxID=1840588 RepID=A0ACC0GJ81_9ERIC|nr:putative aquaporin TIP5-1 [Camellia lanceoleosa]